MPEFYMNTESLCKEEKLCYRDFLLWYVLDFCLQIFLPWQYVRSIYVFFLSVL